MPDSGTQQQTDDNLIAERIVIRGLVQGVGFRPAVWRIARDLNICGSVANNGNGVEIIAQAAAEVIRRFVATIQQELPPLSRIDAIERKVLSPKRSFSAFKITKSSATAVKTGIVPDAAVCVECRDETFDQFSRRFRYPFTNCTNCGPRLSIINDIPYDRATTTMHSFEMCADCRAEYEEPADRRFHAQPIACFKCGPKVWLERSDAKPMAVDSLSTLDDAAAVCTLIGRGHIIAIKGIGGFQLACDATNEMAVSHLRELKGRERKPFALMVRDIEVALEFCKINDAERQLLASPAAPIVILDRLTGPRPNAERENPKKIKRFGTEPPELSPAVAINVAPSINTLGVMLPNSPLHHLIMRRMSSPIVLTSGNLSDEPQAIDNAEAVRKLGHIAGYFVMNDRPIAQRVDDSVIKVIAGEPRVFRRARGLAPSAFLLPKGFEETPEILAFGGELKNTFCLIREGQAIVSQHIGDLENAETFADYGHNLGLYKSLYQHQPTVLACDLHPEYLSGKLARERSELDGTRLIETQHHHAHIASCMAENGVPLDCPPVIGVALDGIGFGDDGTFWGGEFMLADYYGYKRLGAFKPVAMIGGDMAIKEPWRNTYAHLMAEMGWPRFALNYDRLDLYSFLSEKPRVTLDLMIQKGVNSPLTSSCGRLFDAVAAAVGICREKAVYEGQGAIELEASVDQKTLSTEDDPLAYPFETRRLAGSNLLYIEPFGMWQALLGDMILSTTVPVMAARFHKGLAKAIVQMVEKLSKFESGDDPVKTVALSGGVWHNGVLMEQVVVRLERLEFRVLTHRQFPSGDGGLSLGQAAIAAARILSEPPAIAGG